MKMKQLRTIKPEIRTLGVDDGGNISSSNNISIIGAVFRCGAWLDGILRAKIDVAGINSTSKLTAMINQSSHSGQIRVILLGSIFFGKSNFVDINKLSLRTGKPVIALLRKHNIGKDGTAFNQAKFNILQSLKSVEIKSKKKIFYAYLSGIEHSNAEKVFKATSKVEAIPESLRIAQLTASALNNLG